MYLSLFIPNVYFKTGYQRDTGCEKPKNQGKSNSTQTSTSVKCAFCPLSFKTKSSYYCHRLLHTKGRSPDCKKCGKTFRYYQTWKEHQKVCKVKRMESERRLQRHELIHSNRPQFPSLSVKKYKCNFCAASFKSYTTMWSHRKLHQIGGLRCKNCDRQFSSYSSYYKHVKVCNKNGQSTSKPESSRSSSTNVNTENDYEIDDEVAIINQKEGDGQSGDPSQKANHGSKCSICGIRFLTTAGLAIHLRKTHNKVVSKNLCCETCKTQCDSYRDWKYHKKQCTPDSPIMSNNWKTSKEAKTYKCSLCPKMYTYYKVLQSHMKIHTKDALSCLVCGKLFTEFPTLYKHQKKCKLALKSNITSKDKWVIKCPDCEVELPSQNALNGHSLIHKRGLDPVCKSCGKKNIYYNTVMYHKRHCTPTNPVRARGSGMHGKNIKIKRKKAQIGNWAKRRSLSSPKKYKVLRNYKGLYSSLLTTF